MLKKDITFIYMDTAERNMYQPIAEEAEKRGYKVSFTDDKTYKCEIGFYCQHINFPQFSKFSVIMLHDIIQQYSNWPNIWYREPWDKYDIGILPSKQWEENWNQCSQWSYACPRKGMFRIGWPKADVIIKLKNSVTREGFYKEHGLDIHKRTILYAPAWENDNKQDEFVQSMLKLDVNILIKQAKWAEQYVDIIKNIKEMYYLHKDNPRVTILPPETNIFEAIAVSDVLVSEESSTMCEAIMMGIPAVSVSNWLIPDVTPSRLPMCDYDFVIMTKKESLTECISEIINDYSRYQKQAQKFSEKTFSNIGKTSSMIMDIVDDCVSEKVIRYKSLDEKEKVKESFKDKSNRLWLQFKNEVYGNYVHRFVIFRAIWSLLRTIKRMFK